MNAVQENVIDQNYIFFKKNLGSFKKKYLNKWLLISNEELKEVFENQEDAFEKGVQSFGLGNFIVQFCTSSEEKNIFHSRVRFL